MLGKIVSKDAEFVKEIFFTAITCLLFVNSQSKCNSGGGSGGYSEKSKMVVLSLGNFLAKGR